MSTYYDEYRNSYYNPDDVEENPGDNQNWKMIQKGFDSVEKEVIGLFFRIALTENLTVAAGESEYVTRTLTDTEKETLLAAGGAFYCTPTLTVTRSDNHQLGISDFCVTFTAANTQITHYGTIDPPASRSAETHVYVRIHNYSDSDVTLTPANTKITLHFGR